MEISFVIYLDIWWKKWTIDSGFSVLTTHSFIVFDDARHYRNNMPRLIKWKKTLLLWGFETEAKRKVLLYTLIKMTLNVYLHSCIELLFNSILARVECLQGSAVWSLVWCLFINLFIDNLLVSPYSHGVVYLPFVCMEWLNVIVFIFTDLKIKAISKKDHFMFVFHFTQLYILSDPFAIQALRQVLKTVHCF